VRRHPTISVLPRVEAVPVSDWAQSLAAFGSAAAVVTAGAFALFKYRTHREGYPRVELRTDVAFVGVQHGFWLSQLKANVQNVGSVRVEFHEATYSLSCVYAEDRFEQADDEEIQYRHQFPHKMKEGGNWLNATSEFTYNFAFLEPGTGCDFYQDVLIPQQATFVCLESLFIYSQGDDSSEGDGHRRVFRVPTEEDWEAKHPGEPRILEGDGRGDPKPPRLKDG
jgi:hypothetical protein